jgi:hypothetical protein
MNEKALIKMVDSVYQKYKDFLKDPGTPEKAKDIIRALGAIKDGKLVMPKEGKGNDEQTNN